MDEHSNAEIQQGTTKTERSAATTASSSLTRANRNKRPRGEEEDDEIAPTATTTTADDAATTVDQDEQLLPVKPSTKRAKKGQAEAKDDAGRSIIDPALPTSITSSSSNTKPANSGNDYDDKMNTEPDDGSSSSSNNNDDDGGDEKTSATIFSPVRTRSRKQMKSIQKDDNVPKEESKTGITRSRRRRSSKAPQEEEDEERDDEDKNIDEEEEGEEEAVDGQPADRWRVHQMAEEYVDLVGSMMYPATRFRPYGFNPEKREYPLEGISLLGFMKSPLRRPSIIERWSPYEISIFEAGLLHYGKEFRDVSREIGTKTTKEVVDFYYVWKKTGHYKKWKEQFISEGELDFSLSPIKKPKR